jgi:predicted MFS family arabinose efflux permease
MKRWKTDMNRRQAWTIALVVFFAGIALALVQNKVAPCILTLVDDFGIDMATAGLLSSLFSLVGIVISLPAAIILNRIGPKLGGVVALACAIVGSLLGVFAQEAGALMASRVIEGMGVGIISIIGPSLVSMWFPHEKRGLPMSIWGSYQMAAQATMFFLGGVLTVNFGWQGMWWFALIICVAALALYIPIIKSPRPEESFADVESSDVSIAEGMRSASTWFLALATMLFCVACFGFVTWIAPCWSETFGWDIDRANMWVGYFSLAGVIMAVIVGALLNRIKNRKRFGMVALFVYGAIAVVGIYLQTPSFILLFVIAYSFFDAAVPCIIWTLTPQTVKKPELVGVALGIVSLGLNVGILAGPPLIGAVAEAFGWQAASWPMLGACILSIVCLGLCRLHVVKTRSQDQQTPTAQDHTA